MQMNILTFLFWFSLQREQQAPKPENFINESHKVAYEVLTSERTYVDRLNLLDQVSVKEIEKRWKGSYTLSHFENDRLLYRARNLCVFTQVQKWIPGLRHKGCVLQRLSFDALGDVTVVLEMTQSIGKEVAWILK